MKERAIAVLAGLQRNAAAMNVLRSNLESRISHTMGKGGNAESCKELTRMLDLVKNGEMILSELTLKAESARFLEEFIRIIDSASTSFGEIKHDLQELVPVAEAALSEMHDAIAGMTPETAMELKKEVELSVLTEPPIDVNKSNQSLAERQEGQKEVAVPRREPKQMQEIEGQIPI
ncbi:MAG TPA: hypothetical protein VIB07_09585 [Nitrososphaera sp.]|jgi:hypothetical protein